MLLTDRDRQAPVRTVGARRAWGTALAFGLVATAVSASGSWIPSLWGDEAASVMSARRPVGSLLMMLTHVDAVHGLYYLLMHAWTAVFGASPFALRFPSAVAVGLAVAAVTLIAGRLRGPTAAIVAGVVATVLPRLTYAGEEARSFAMTAAIASWLTLLFLWLIEKRGEPGPGTHVRRRLGWVAYAAMLGFGTTLFLYFGTIVVAHVALLLSTRASRSTVRAWMISAGAGLLVASPVALLAYFERHQIAYLGRQPLDELTLLYTPWFSSAWIAAVAWALILLALWAAWRAWRQRTRTAPGTATALRDGEPSLAMVAATWLLLPTGLLVVVDLMWPMYTARYSTFAAPAAALLITEGLLVLARLAGRGRPKRILAVLVVATVAFVALCTPAYVSQRGPFSKNDSDWAEASAVVGHYAKPGDAVVFDGSASPSRRPRLAMHTYPAGFAAVTDPTLKVPFTANTTWYDSTYTIAHAAERGRFDGVRRVWLLENITGGRLDTWGVSDLTHLGFEPTGLKVQVHRTVVIEYTR